MAISKRAVWLAVAVLVAVGTAFSAMMVFGWMIDETHFDRPDEGFDRLTSQLDSMPGVRVEEKERWVEAPTFSKPNSWVVLAVDGQRLDGVLSAACSTGYPDPVMWSFRVSTDGGSVVTLLSGTPGQPVGGASCLDFGFDAVGLVDEVGGYGLGVNLQASVWDNGRFALVALDDSPETLSALLPLVEHTDDLRAAAGLDPSRPVEISGSALGLIVAPGEHDRYLDLLAGLVDEHDVTGFWADGGGGTPVDGVEKVQIAAPESEHDAVADAIRTSGLHIAGFPVRFLPR